MVGARAPAYDALQDRTRQRAYGRGEMAQASLSGNINAVGLLELLRIPMTTKRTGTLIVICEDDDVVDAEARFQYDNGTLVTGSLGPLTGEDALRRMLTWRDGEFEFIPDTQFEGERDPRLHPVVLAELKSWYSARAGVSSSSSSGSRPAATASTSSPAVATSAVAPPAAATAPPASAQRLAPVRQPAGPVSALPRYQQPRVATPAPAPAAPISSALGAGTLDTRGNLRDVSGQLSPRDGALVFAALQVGAAIGKDMGVGNPNEIEIRGKGARWLAAVVRGESAAVVACPPDTDLTEELARR
jgi:hypothetical protein